MTWLDLWWKSLMCASSLPISLSWLLDPVLLHFIGCFHFVSWLLVFVFSDCASFPCVSEQAPAVSPLLVDCLYIPRLLYYYKASLNLGAHIWLMIAALSLFIKVSLLVCLLCRIDTTLTRCSFLVICLWLITMACSIILPAVLACALGALLFIR